MIADDGYLKLIDYGFAKTVTKRTYTICGTPEYIAPEILLNKGHGKPVDWWTFGILIYEMHAGHAPFIDDDPMNIYKKIINTKPRYPDGFDSKLKSLVKQLISGKAECWEKNSHKFQSIAANQCRKIGSQHH